VREKVSLGQVRVLHVSSSPCVVFSPVCRHHDERVALAALPGLPVQSMRSRSRRKEGGC
jgi:hypothetical protein